MVIITETGTRFKPDKAMCASFTPTQIPPLCWYQSKMKVGRSKAAARALEGYSSQVCSCQHMQRGCVLCYGCALFTWPPAGPQGFTESCPAVQQFTLSFTWIWPEPAFLQLVKILLARDWSRTALETILLSCRGKILAIQTSCVQGQEKLSGFVLFIGIGLNNELCLIKPEVLKKD